MGLLDDATSMLDAATGGKSTSQAKATAHYEPKESLSLNDQDDAIKSGTSYAGQDDKPNTVDPGIPTEFIHFGYVHPDKGKKFTHDAYADPPNQKAAPDGHAIMFRDALEREAIALFGFVSSTKQILKDATGSRGTLDAVADMASNLLGGGSGKSKPDPQQLDTFLSDIESAMQTINKPAVLYPEIHEAGKKLHETRATYVKFCETLNDFYITTPDSSNPMDMAQGAIANVPGVGNIMATVMRFAFKMFDLYLAAYLQLRSNHELIIETAAHDLTIKAIKIDYKDFALTYPIWFPKPEPKKAEETETKKDDDKGNLLKDVNDKVEETKKDAEEKVDNVKKDVKEKLDKAYDFLGVNGEPKPTPGTSALGEIFGKLKGGSPETTTDPPAFPSASACLIGGVDAAMQDIHGVPEFVKNVMTKINDANLGMLEEIYARLMFAGAAGEINSEYLLAAGRRHLSKKIVTIMADLASGVLPGGGDFTFPVPGSDKTLSAQAFVTKLIEDKLIHFVDPIIKFAIGDLAGQMEASRKKAEENNAQTMEVLLGRLPWLTALMFKNTFFPIWNLVVEKVFENIAPPVAKVLKEVNSIFEKAKDTVDTASDYANRAGHVKDKAASGVSSLSDIDQLKDSAKDESPEAKARREAREKAAKDKQAMDDFYKPNDKDEKFPVVMRVADGEGVKVEEEVPSVITDAPQTGDQQPAGDNQQASPTEQAADALNAF